MWMTNATEGMGRRSVVGINSQNTTVAGTKRGTQAQQQGANTPQYAYAGVRRSYQDIASFSEMPKEGRVLVRGRLTGAAATNKKTWRNTMQEDSSKENTFNTAAKRVQEERKEQEQQKKIAAQKEMLRQMIQKQREATKNGEERADDMAKIMEIARRIADGDTVPQSDEKKLMEYSADLYQVAKAAAMTSRDNDHKKYDALFEDEEKDKQNTADENDCEIPFGGKVEQGETAVSAENSEVAGMAQGAEI